MTQDNAPNPQGQIPLHGYITYAQALQLIADAIGQLRIYVSESDITSAQQAVKRVETDAKF